MKRSILAIVVALVGCGHMDAPVSETDQQAIDGAAVSFYPGDMTVPGNNVWSMVEVMANDERVTVNVEPLEAHFILVDGTTAPLDDTTAAKYNAYVNVLQPDETEPTTGHAAAQAVTAVLSVTFVGTPTLMTSNGVVLNGHPVRQTYRINDGPCDPFQSSGCP